MRTMACRREATRPRRQYFDKTCRRNSITTIVRHGSRATYAGPRESCPSAPPEGRRRDYDHYAWRRLQPPRSAAQAQAAHDAGAITPEVTMMYARDGRRISGFGHLQYEVASVAFHAAPRTHGTMGIGGAAAYRVRHQSPAYASMMRSYRGQLTSRRISRRHSALRFRVTRAPN